MEDQSASGQRAIDVDWPICLTILRIIRRWSEEDLAEACGLRRGTVSDYERGKMIPGLKTMERLLTAQGYPFAALDEALAFIQRVRAAQLGVASTESSAEAGPPARRRELEEAAVAAGAVLSQILRLLFRQANPPAGIPTAQPNSHPKDGGDGTHEGNAGGIDP